MTRLVLAFAIMAAACSSPAPEPSSPQSLRKISLPDLTGMTPSVQQQLRDQLDVLTRTEADPTVPPETRAAAYGDMGKLLLAAESFADAEPCFLNASLLNPADLRWTYYLAHVYRLQGDSQKAASYFERTLQLRSDDVAALVWLGNVYLDQGRSVEAGPLFSRALALDSRVAAAQAGFGRVALAARDYKGAIEHLEAARALDPGANSVRYSLAAAYRGAGQNERADAELRLRGSVPFAPPDPLMQDVAGLLRSPVAYEGRGDRALARGEFPRAVTEFRAGLELAPDNLSLRQKLATSLSLTGDVQGALKQLQDILRRDPTFASAHYTIGALLLADGQADLAIEQFASAVKFEPTYLQARLQLANTLSSRGRFERAREQYAAIISLDPRFAEARFGEALALAALKRYADARDRLAEGTRLHPDRVEFLAVLVRVLAAAPDSGVRDGERAVTLATELVKRQSSALARDAMAMALAEAGRFEEAAATEREAIAMAEQTGQRDLASAMRANLQLFEHHLPSQTPWREPPVWEAS